MRPLLTKLRALFRRSTHERDMAEEMRFHLDQRTADNISSDLPPSEARYAAQRKFGNIGLLQERARDQRRFRWLEETMLDVRHAARQLRRNPGFTLVAITTLALGIGANTAMFSVCNAVLLRPLPLPELDRLVFFNPAGSSDFSGGDFIDLSQGKSFTQFAAYTLGSATLAGAGEAERVEVAHVTAGFLPTLGIEPWRGRNIRPEEDRDGGDSVVLLSHALWQRKFNGTDDALGQVVSFNGQSHTIIGVLPAGIDVPPGRDLFVPLALTPAALSNYGAYSLKFLARLHPGVAREAAETEMAARFRRDSAVPEFRKTWQIRLASLLEARVGGARRTLLILMGAVGLLVLVACSNLANLLLASATQRRKEIAVRLSLGASRPRIVRQFLTESLLLSLLGGIAGLLLAGASITLIRAGMPAGMPRVGEIGLDARVLGFTAFVALAAGVAFGTLPALRASQTTLTEALKSGGRSAAGGVGQQRVRSLLVVAQVALTIVLLTGAGLLVKSFVRLQETPLGFRPERLLTARMALPGPGYATPAQRATFTQRLLEEIRRQPGLSEAGLVSRLPFTLGNETYRVFKEGEQEWRDSVAFRSVSPAYLRVLGVPLLQGRELTEADHERAARVVVINDVLAQQLWPNESPIGRRLLETSRDRGWREIVGVVGSVRHRSKAVPPAPEIFVPWAQTPGTQVNLVIRTNVEPEILGGTLRRAVTALDPELPVYELRTMETRLHESVAQPRFQTMLLSAFAAISLVVAAVGLYGVMACSVSQRTQELGVRMALGARPGDVVGMVVGQGLKLAGLGVALGLVGAFALTRLLEKMLYDVTTTDPLTFAATPALLVAIALLACWWPARRAAKVDPISALRAE